MDGAAIRRDDGVRAPGLFDERVEDERVGAGRVAVDRVVGAHCAARAAYRALHNSTKHRCIKRNIAS